MLGQLNEESKRHHPVAFFSKKLSKAERRYGATARELLGLVLGLKRWKHHLLGGRVELWTDCKPLTWLRTQAELAPMHARWLDLFEMFDLELKYVKGEKNVVADALSRRSDLEELDDAGLLSMQALFEDDELYLGAVADLANAEEHEAAVQRTFEEALKEVRAGYDGDPLVTKALAEETRRPAGERRPAQSRAQMEAESRRVDAAARRQAVLEAATKRILRAAADDAKERSAAAAASIEAGLAPLTRAQRKAQEALGRPPEAPQVPDPEGQVRPAAAAKAGSRAKA